MVTVMPALALIAIVGASLYRVLPNFDPDATRRQCGTLVLNVMLPALNIEVIYTAPVAALPGIAAGRHFGRGTRVISYTLGQHFPVTSRCPVALS